MNLPLRAVPILAAELLRHRELVRLRRASSHRMWRDRLWLGHVKSVRPASTANLLAVSAPLAGMVASSLFSVKATGAAAQELLLKARNAPPLFAE